MASGIYPLVFEPILQPRIWGGRRLQTLLGKRLPEGQAIGESWEVADLEHGQSVVASGPMRGKTLAEVLAHWGDDLLGRTKTLDGRFPLLIKFLDAKEVLSVQVHPNESAAARLGGGVRVKDEAWYVLEAEPGAFIYHGVCEGVRASQLPEALAEGRVEQLLRRVPVRQGHCYYLPSGTVHALGRGLLVAEVQTPSDTTYRLFDWDRIDPATGRRRDLHVNEALECAIYETVPPEQTPQHTASVWTSVTSLCRCRSFVIERVRMVAGVEMELPHAEMVIWIVLEGEVNIACQATPEPVSLRRGDTVVLPAGLKHARVRTKEQCMWLEVTVPVPSALAGFDRPDPASRSAVRYVPLNAPGHAK
jgi:mannose-6-phosphate isomerase